MVALVGAWLAGLLACATGPGGRDWEPGHALGGVVRLPLTTLREDLIVPQAHTGPGLDLGLRYAAAVGAGASSADLAFGARYLEGRYGARALDFHHGLRLRHAFTVARGPWSFGVGPAFGWETDIAYLESWDDSHAYWSTDRWLGPTASAWTSLSDCWRLDIHAELLLVSVQSRPAGRRTYEQDELDAFAFWFAAAQRHPRFAWIGDTQRLRVGAELWRSRSRTALADGWGLGLELRLVRAAEPEPFVLLEAALTLSTAWGFE